MTRFDTPNPITAKVELARGTLHIIASDRSDTVVQIRPRDAGKAPDLKTADRTTVTYRDGLLAVQSSHGLTFRTGTVDIVIELPRHSILDVSVASAEVRVDGELADTRFHSSSGDLIADAISGVVDIATASGGASLREVGGDIAFQTASGDLAIKTLRGHAKVASASGSVTVGTAIAGGLIFDTASGNTSLGIAEGTSAHLQIDTHSGVVTNALESVDAPVQGDETFQVRVRSASGDVDLHRPVVFTG